MTKKNINKPLVSICIPSYNNAIYLDACIKSAIKQTYRNIEIILVDDCSQDESLNIAKKYIGKIKIFVNKRNLGQPKNTNKCVRLSNGKYTVILHSDDILLSDFVEKLIPLFEKNTGVSMAVGERIIIDETKIQKKISPFYNVNCVVPGIKQAKIFMMTSFLPCQVLFRRDIFNKIRGVDEGHIVNLDGLLWFKFALQGDVAYIKDTVSIYRIHRGQTTVQCAKTITHMLDYYCTLKEIFRIAKNISYLQQYFSEALERIGELTLRYCHYVMEEKNYELAKRYLALATFFNPKIIEHNLYKIIKKCLSSAKKDPYERYITLINVNNLIDRGFSYNPPEGSIIIK